MVDEQLVQDATPAAGDDRGEQAGSTDTKVLAAAQLAFDRGDYRLVYQLTERLMHSGSDDTIVEAATRLRARLGTDPLTKLLLLLTGLLLVAVTLYAYSRGHG